MGALFNLKDYSFYKFKDRFKEMKKIAYITPEMEIVELKLSAAVLLNQSYADGPGISDEPGSDDPDDVG